MRHKEKVHLGLTYQDFLQVKLDADDERKATQNQMENTSWKDELLLNTENKLGNELRSEAIDYNIQSLSKDKHFEKTYDVEQELAHHHGKRGTKCVQMQSEARHGNGGKSWI